jgi:WD40 repeat protein/class 3 adenylate cyclase
MPAATRLAECFGSDSVLDLQDMADDSPVGTEVAGSGQGKDAAIRTFLIADVRGYTVFTQDRGDEAAALLAGRFAAVAREAVAALDGTVVELRGDEALVVFDSARQAIRAAIELQRRFVDATIADPTLPLAVGIGLDAGEAVPVDGGYRGGALNLAARLCSVAGPAEILASTAVTHLARKVDGVAYVDRGAVRLKGLDDPVQVIRLHAEADDPAEDIAFRRALGSAAARLVPNAPGAIVANPYKGLRAFEEADAADYFGREELIQQLVKRLEGTRFLAVVGPSGSGKSSVVRAGLLPAIRRGAIPASERWWMTDMFPGARPLDGLEAALLRAVPDPPTSVMDQLERDEHGLHRAILRLLPSDASELVLVIDQFEEVFTLVEDEAVRVHFLGSLESAVSDPRSRLRVVTTLRADFYDRPLLYRGFAELFKSRVEAVIPLSAEELERAISGPAKRVDVSPEPGLVAAVLADVAEEPGALPLMQYALTELFERRDGRTLSLEAYREIGGVSGALGRRAEELYAELDGGGREAARQLFLRLVALGEGTEDTRRRVPRSEIASLEVDQQAMTAVLDSFGASRQLSFDRDTKTGAATIELAHEAMLTAWPRLSRWIDAAREELRIERRVAAAAREWVESDRDRSFLLGGSRLEQAEAWRSGSGIALTPEEGAYLDASRAERDRRQADEEARAAHERDLERRSVRRLRALVGVLAVGMVVAIALTIFATRESGRAAREERNANARELAAASVANLEVDPERSILLALEGIDLTRSVDGSVLPEAEEALHRAVTASRIVLSEPDLGGALDWSPDGVFVTEGPENSGRIDIRDAMTGASVRIWESHDDINDVRFSQDGSMLATSGDDGALRVWDPGSGEPIAAVQGEAGPVLGVSFDAGGSLVAASWLEGEGSMIRIARPATGEVVRTIDPPGLAIDTALSPDGERVVAGDLFGDVARVYDVATGEEILVLPGHRYGVSAVSWSPDGRWIATASRDPFVRVWNAETGELEARLSGHTGGEVITVDWGPDSRRLVSGGSDGTARVWEVDEVEGREVFTLTAQQTQAATLAAFSPDGEQVLTGDVGIGAVQIWDLSLQGDAEVMNLPTDDLAPVDVDTLPDGRIVASARDGSVSVWRTDGTHEATIGPGGGPSEPVWRIAASPEGGRIATVRMSSGVLSAWDVGTGDRVFEVDAYPSGEVSSIDWSPDGRYLAAGSLLDDRVTIFGADGDRITVLEEPASDVDYVETLAFSPGGRVLAVAATNTQEPGRSHVSIWDWERGEEEQTIDTAWTTALAFDPIGSTFAAGLFDGNVEIRDVATGDIVREFQAHSGRVADLAYSPDGAWIATAGEDGTVALFDAASGGRRFVLPGHGFLVSGLAFSPDGRWLITTAPDGVVRVWTLDLDELIRIAEGEVTRELTDDECRQYLHLPEGCP